MTSTFENKVLQRAVAMVLEAVYEQDFRDCSYGFRPRRSAHQALETLWEWLMAVGCGTERCSVSAGSGCAPGCWKMGACRTRTPVLRKEV